MCSPFYQNLMQEHHLEFSRMRKDWDSIPITNKTMLAQAGENIIPFSYYSEKAKGKLMVKLASGSTGKCLKLFWSKEDLKREEDAVWKYRQLWYGIKPQSTYCYFYTFENHETKERQYHNVNHGMGIPKCNFNKERVKEIYERLLCYQPEWIQIAPSIACVLAKYIRESGLEKIESIKYIELYGELISPQEREEIENAFGCIARRRYGCKEVGTIAYECPYGEMHVMTESVHVEICKDGHAVFEGMEGNIIVTSMQNHVTPFVRYDTDDRGILARKSCNCGLEGEVLEITRGQESGWIQWENGECFHSSDFARAFLKIMYQREVDMKQYQIIQRKWDYFDIYIVSETKEEIIRSHFLREMENTPLKDAVFQFHCLNEKLLANRVNMNTSFRCDVKG